MSTRSIVPLHSDPPPPALLSQEAVSQGAADVAEAALWCYRLRYWHPHAAQDEVLITASFNIPSLDETAIVAGDTPPRVEYRFGARLEYSADGERIEALRLTRGESEAVSAGRWPSIDYHTSSGLAVELGNGKGEGAVRTYAFDPPVLSGEWPIIGVTWSGLGIAGMQNACASLAAVRNGDLDPQDASEDYLVYRTATTYASEAATPFNHWPQTFDISDLGDTLDTALDAAFRALFGERRIGQRIRIELRYGYRLSPEAEPGIEQKVYLPVALYPNHAIAADTAAQITAAASAWKDLNNPAATGGEWLFSLVQFSQIDTRTPRPLLELSRIVYRLR
jgi:hypothetical protein